LDLPLDLGAIDDRTLYDVGIVLRKPVLDRGEVRNRSPHPDQRVRRAPRPKPGEIGSDCIRRCVELRWRNHPAKAVLLGIPNRADIQTETLFDPRTAAEGELRAPPA